MKGQPVGGLAATLAIARLTWKRLLRGKALWVSLVLALAPMSIAIAVVGKDNSGGLGDVLEVSTWLLGILAPLHIAASLAEELEERTSAYLWSRPVPRWTIVSGKLLALVPVVALLEVGGALIAAQQIGALGASTNVQRVLVGLGAGTIAASCCAAGVATIWPKHGMAIAMVYILLVDLPLGAIPAALQQLSITHYVRELVDKGAGIEIAPLGGLAVISLVWLSVALSRIRTLE